MDEELKQTRNEIRMHLRIGVVLVALIVTSIGIALLPFNGALHIIIGLLIAAVMASLVLVFFMHFKTERKLIHYIMISAGFCFLVLILLCVLAYYDYAGQATVTRF